MDVNYMAKLANLPLKKGEREKFGRQFEETLKTVGVIGELPTSSVGVTRQIIGLVNVAREDKIEKERILPVEMALSQANKTYKNYFVAPPVFDAE